MIVLTIEEPSARTLAARKGWATRRMRAALRRREWANELLREYVARSGLAPYIESDLP